MLEALDITEAEALGLSELAQHDLALARDYARRALAAEDNEEAGRLGRSYQRAARSYRQTLAVKARLKRDLAVAAHARAQAEAAAPKPRPGQAAVARRIGELRTALLRLGWDEAERPESDGTDVAPDGGGGEGAATVDFETACRDFGYRRADIDDLIADERASPEFCDEPLDDHVARLALHLRFPPGGIGRWPDLPDPPGAALARGVHGIDWRSSA
ncbi:hypothetical protein [Phenylobacterium sp.]|uniref:hypothetical protein n=1 Tax=Phenylobacterium sp. TaxID=1871053 RepID=UPI00301D5EC4